MQAERRRKQVLPVVLAAKITEVEPDDSSVYRACDEIGVYVGFYISCVTYTKDEE